MEPNPVDVCIAHAYIILTQERATEGVMHALTLLDAALPLRGTPERRAAFLAAHGRKTTTADA